MADISQIKTVKLSGIEVADILRKYFNMLDAEVTFDTAAEFDADCLLRGATLVEDILAKWPTTGPIPR